MAQQKPQTFREQAEQRLQDEAMGVAKSIQVPGQTKDQTKLIAKGIEKGIALYKQQQKAKARERDREKKKGNRQQPSENVLPTQEDQSYEYEGSSSPARPALLMAGVIFCLVSLFHTLRYFLAWRLVFSDFDIPLSWSIVAAILAAGLAFWMFRATKDA